MKKQIIFAIIIIFVICALILGRFIFVKEKPKKMELFNCTRSHMLFCYAVATSNPNLCRQLTTDIKREECFQKVQSITAISGEEVSSCDNISSVYFGILCRALILKSEDECNHVEEVYQPICRSIVNRDCSKVKDKEIRKSCEEIVTFRAAFEAKEPNVCGQISSEAGELFCRAAISRNERVCDELVDDLIIPLCRKITLEAD